MPAKVVEEKCKSCKECVDICPTGAIEMHEDKAFVVVDLCADCTACVDACPSKCIEME